MSSREDMPRTKTLRKCKGCGQYAVYRGKWGEEFVWRCKYCGLVIPLNDDEIAKMKSDKRKP